MYTSETGVKNMRDRVRQAHLEEHNKTMKNLLCIKFDGKTNWEAMIHNQPEQAHFVTGSKI